MMRGPDTATRGGWKLVLVCAVLLGACRDPATASGTALYVTTQFEPTLLLTQVRVWGTVEEGAPFGPHVLPEQPARLLSSGETLRVLLGDVPNGVRARVYVEGLRDGGAVARGEGTVQIRDGYEVEVSLRLEPASPGTFCIGCTGCCQDGTCIGATLETCGAGGNTCVTCDPARTDTCDARGLCVCGANPACTGLNVDRCENGQCKCGNNGPCAQGQECVDGSVPVHARLVRGLLLGRRLRAGQYAGQVRQGRRGLQEVRQELQRGPRLHQLSAAGPSPAGRLSSR